MSSIEFIREDAEACLSLDVLSERERESRGYDLQDLYDLTLAHWHKPVFDRKYIGLSQHNKANLRKLLSKDLSPLARLTQLSFRNLMMLGNLIGYLFSSEHRSEWLLYALG